VSPPTTRGDAAARLAAGLADRYRIERELGQGGMATVYLAEDLKHHRKVAVKVLRPELAESVGSARFLREIDIAAQLTHPHILPLHDSGEAGGFLYYVMPYVEGESLRAKLAREGALPTGDATRYLREVAEALAYAHRNGVVHRDIKPDNVLISEHHAVVTDFGVAKAVSESTGSSTFLTSLGVALGTPAYMAPEQAAADLHVDHRADIYALGVLAYEMLSGRPPFSAPTPQGLLAAQITETPDPVTRYRPNVPPPLNALVMRCLEKRAPDRWQSATDLVAQLDAMGTPSGGMAPTTVQSVITPGSEAAIRRGHPGRVAALFAIASIIVLAVVRFLMLRLGLPDWVLWAACVLLGIGLPIMLLTGLHERRRAIAQTPLATRAAVEPEVGHWFTWRRALLGGVLAFVGLGFVAGGYTAMRLLGIGPVGTLLAAGVLKERELLLLADFQNRTADTTLGPSLTEAMRVDLSQSPRVRVMDQQAVRDALQRMQRADAGPLSAALAREVAERQGIKAVVNGQIDPVGGGYLLTASLVSAVDGRALAAVRETAESPGELLKAIDRLSGKLRERIGESLVTIRANPPLEQVTTASLPALRKYSEAVRLQDGGRQEEAVPLLEEAVALDTGFAMAYRKLAAILSNISGSRVRAVDAATRAYAHRDRLPEVERDLAVAGYHWLVDYNPSKIIAAFRSALVLDPDNTIALNNLALQLNAGRRWVEAETLAARATRVDSSGFYYDNLLDAKIAMGHLADARATTDRWAKVAPDDPFLHFHRAAIAANERDYATSERHLQALQRGAQASPGLQALAVELLARASERSGKLAEAAHHIRDEMELQEQRGLPQEYVNAATGLAEFEISYRSRPAAALGILSDALAKHPLDSIPALDRPLTRLASIYAQAGKVELAKQLMRQFERDVPEGIRRGMWWRHWPEGYIALADGRKTDALMAFRALYEEGGSCNVCGLYELAGVYDSMRQADSAIALYERAVSTPATFGRLIGDGPTLAPSLKRLGELYEAKGDRQKAAEYYGRFVELWKNADPELQPGVREIRGRIARLAQEPGA
jgi:tetratricopeptide (TPR) repeat protein/tRNA A-37 threonylcarbamoyl transferase component Bud32